MARHYIGDPVHTDQIDYTKVTGNIVLINCMKCKGDGTLTALILINESGEVTAYRDHGCSACESN